MTLHVYRVEILLLVVLCFSLTILLKVMLLKCKYYFVSCFLYFFYVSIPYVLVGETKATTYLYGELVGGQWILFIIKISKIIFGIILAVAMLLQWLRICNEESRTDLCSGKPDPHMDPLRKHGNFAFFIGCAISAMIIITTLSWKICLLLFVLILISFCVYFLVTEGAELLALMKDSYEYDSYELHEEEDEEDTKYLE